MSHERYISIIDIKFSLKNVIKKSEKLSTPFRGGNISSHPELKGFAEVKKVEYFVLIESILTNYRVLAMSLTT